MTANCLIDSWFNFKLVFIRASTIEFFKQGYREIKLRETCGGDPARRAARYSPRHIEGEGWAVTTGRPVKYECPAGVPYNKYRDGACFLAPPFPPPPPITAPSSSSTLIKNSYILISRGCVVSRIVAIDVLEFSCRRSRRENPVLAKNQDIIFKYFNISTSILYTFISLNHCEDLSRRYNRIEGHGLVSQSRARGIRMLDLTVWSILKHVPLSLILDKSHKPRDIKMPNLS